MANFPTYLTLFLLMGACTFNSENSLSDKDGGTDIRDDAGELIDDASVSDAGLVIHDGALPDAALTPDGPPTPPPTCDPANQDLVLCMTFDGLPPNTTTVPDLSGNNHVTTFSNGTITMGQDGMGMQTEAGFTSRIAATPALNNAKTIEMWVRPNTIAPSYQGLFEGNGYYFYIYNGGVLGCEADGINNDQGISQNSVISANQWQHVACVINDNGVKLFVNGTQIMNRSAGLEDFADAQPNHYTIGRGSSFWDPIDVSVTLEGKIDTLRVWSTDRSGQICANCDTPVPPPQ